MLPWGTCDSKVPKEPFSFRNLNGFRGLYTETRLGPETPQVHPIKAWSLIKAPVKIQTPIKAPVATSTSRGHLSPRALQPTPKETRPRPSPPPLPAQLHCSRTDPRRIVLFGIPEGSLSQEGF